MQFLETNDGHLINPAHVKYFHVDEDGMVHAVFGKIVRSDGVVTCDDAITFRGGKTRAEAMKTVAAFCQLANSEAGEHVAHI